MSGVSGGWTLQEDSLCLNRVRHTVGGMSWSKLAVMLDMCIDAGTVYAVHLARSDGESGLAVCGHVFSLVSVYALICYGLVRTLSFVNLLSRLLGIWVYYIPAEMVGYLLKITSALQRFLRHDSQI